MIPMEILFLEVSVTDTCHDAEIFPTEDLTQNS